MSFGYSSKTAQDALSARTTTALRVVVAVSLAAACFMVLAQARAEEVPDSTAARASEHVDTSLEDLERAFWVCDRAATLRGVDGPTGMVCGSVTEQLKQRRFNGDFGAMLAWWFDNKAAMHMLAEQVQGSTEDAETIPQP